MPTCTAFKRSGLPCTAQGRNGGLCGIHWHRNNPVLVAQFNHDQEIYREAWNGIALGTHRIDEERQRVVRVPRAPEVVAPVAPVAGHCTAVKRNGVACTKLAVHGGLCLLHRGIVARREEDAPAKVIKREMQRMHRARRPIHEIEAYVTAHLDGLVLRVRRNLTWELDYMILRPFQTLLDQLITRDRATREQVDAVLIGWAERGELSARRQEMLALRVEAAFHRREWLDQLPRMAAPQRYGPNQREAQLAADSQNVHTAEISKQMQDSLKILLAVEIPEGQQTTVNEIVDSWRARGYPEAEILRVRADVVSWWNRTQIYQVGDKLYKKALRGLWWTIKGYKGEVREELEKRLWDECKDAAIPYSVCTQGHLARLSNVMAGFDDAFVPAVPVGEILQQKMAAISEMDVPYEKQIELAEEVLAELKIPPAEHGNWLAAF